MNLLKKILKIKQTPVKITLTITSSNGFHLRPIAKFVNEIKKFKSTTTIIVDDKEVSATQVPKILSLALEQGDSFILKSIGEDANEAISYLESYFKKLMLSDTKVEIAKQKSENYQASSISGETIFRGIGIAPLFKYRRVETINSTNISIEDAIDLTKKELMEIYEKDKSNSNLEIFLAQKELLSSDIFNQEFSNIDSFKEVINQEIEKLKNSKFKSKVEDYRDLEQRVLSHLGFKRTLELPNRKYLLLADDLLASEVTQISKTPIEGVILQKGSLTSHASILLRSFGIASIIINEKVSNSNYVDNAILDANSGDLILNPTTKDMEKAEIKREEFKVIEGKSFNNRFNPTMTTFGRRVRVLANITDIDSAKEARLQGADGVGLLRTEFLFMKNRPTVDEQTEVYREIFKLFNNITIRTLDIGGDKSLPYINIPKENNPFLGLRGIRFSLYEETLFKEQLLAIFKAHNGKPIKIMFPMISETTEFIRAKKIANMVAKDNGIDISNILFGIMIEVPSVILALKLFDKIVDFYSIGTNDLTQYIFAIDRTHKSLSVNPTSPIIISLLKIIIDITHKPVSICGELAGAEKVTKELINIGYTDFSISPNLIPSLKEKIREI